MAAEIASCGGTSGGKPPVAGKRAASGVGGFKGTGSWCAGSVNGPWSCNVGASACGGDGGWDRAGSGNGAAGAIGLAGAWGAPAAPTTTGLARGRGTALAGGFAGACVDVGVAAGVGTCRDVTAFGAMGSALTVGAFAVDATGMDTTPALDGVAGGLRRGTGGAAEAARTAGAREGARASGSGVVVGVAATGATDGLPFEKSTRTSMRCPHLRHFSRTVSPTMLLSAIWYFASHCSQRNFTRAARSDKR